MYLGEISAFAGEVETARRGEPGPVLRYSADAPSAVAVVRLPGGVCGASARFAQTSM